MPLLYKLPNNFEKIPGFFYPAYLKNHPHYYYFNSEELLTNPNFNDFVLSLFDRQGNEIQSGIGTLIKDEVVSANEYRFYTTFNISSSVKKGIYQLVIYNSNTNEVLFQSDNYIRVIDELDVEKYVYLQYRHSNNIYNYNYELNSNYINLFLRMDLIDYQGDVVLNQVQERTTGKYRNQLSQASKRLFLQTYRFDEGAHDMMLAISIHDDIMVNGIPVVVASPNQVEGSRFKNLKNGIIELIDQRFSTLNAGG